MGAKPPDGLRILVVDDEHRIGTTMRILLHQHQVHTALSGAEAMAALEKQSFDVILCDLLLPDMWGKDLATRAPELEERMVFMTGGAMTDEMADFLAALPAERRLMKPFSSADLQAILRQVRPLDETA